MKPIREELLNRLKACDFSMTDAEIAESIAFFQASEENTVGNLKALSGLHQITLHRTDGLFMHDVQRIRQSCIYQIKTRRGLNRYGLDRLYLDSAEYYFGIKEYPQCIQAVLEVLQSKITPIENVTAAIMLLFTALLRQGVYEPCFSYMEKLQERFETETASPQDMYLAQMAFLQICTLAGETERAQSYYRVLKCLDPLPPGVGAAAPDDLELLYLSLQASLCPAGMAWEELTERLESLCDRKLEGHVLNEANRTEAFLFILKRMNAQMNPLQLAAIAEKYIGQISGADEQLRILGCLFEELEADPSLEPLLYREYISLLRQAFSRNRDHQQGLVSNSLLAISQEAEYRRQALEDRLTKLGNRQAYTELFQQYVDSPKALPAELCFIIMDVDHLKMKNERYGQKAGDQLIRGGASAVRKAFGDGAQVFRYGGDEFVVLMKLNRGELANRLRHLKTACAEWTNSRENKVRTLLSITPAFAYCNEVAVGADKAECLREMCRIANERLFQEKRGRQTMR